MSVMPDSVHAGENNRACISANSAARSGPAHTRLTNLGSSRVLAVVVFMQGDAAAARRLVAEKDRFRSFEREAADRHFARVRGGRTETLEGGTLLLDAVRDLKRIEAHLAATVYPLLERNGELMPSRLTS